MDKLPDWNSKLFVFCDTLILINVWDKLRSLVQNVVESITPMYLEPPSKSKFPSLRGLSDDARCFLVSIIPIMIRIYLRAGNLFSMFILICYSFRSICVSSFQPSGRFSPLSSLALLLVSISIQPWLLHGELLKNRNILGDQVCCWNRWSTGWKSTQGCGGSFYLWNITVIVLFLQF